MKTIFHMKMTEVNQRNSQRRHVQSDPQRWAHSGHTSAVRHVDTARYLTDTGDSRIEDLPSSPFSLLSALGEEHVDLIILLIITL